MSGKPRIRLLTHPFGYRMGPRYAVVRRGDRYRYFYSLNEDIALQAAIEWLFARFVVLNEVPAWKSRPVKWMWGDQGQLLMVPEI